VPPEDPETVGAKDGFAVGFFDGDAVGAVGAAVGAFDGAAVGVLVGGFDGASVGGLEGGCDGATIGEVVGTITVGVLVGALALHAPGRAVMSTQADGALQQAFMPAEIVLPIAARRQAVLLLHAFLMPPI